MTTSPKRRFVTLAKKIVTALSGLALCIFLIGHLAGNLLLLQGAGTFNGYSHFLISLPIIIPLEIGIEVICLIHAYEALTVTLENRKARPIGYRVSKWGRSKSPKSRKTVASTFMMWSGIVILAFTLLHVWHFKFGKLQSGAERCCANGNTGYAQRGIVSRRKRSEHGGKRC